MQAWANINLVMGGGWPPSEMNNMTLDELAQWHAIAHNINERQKC